MSRKTTKEPKVTTSGDVVFYQYGTFKKPKGPDLPLIYVWDIDKTYLNTRFETLKGLFKTAFEKAFQKVNVPGTSTLVRALTGFDQHTPLYFVSASPPQMESKIHQKMQLDGVRPLGIFFKDNLKNLRPKKFKRLKQQVGYKVQGLLELMAHLNQKVSLVLFGDDSESDAVVYNLFSDICARRLPEEEILSILEALHVQPEQRKKILKLQGKIEPHDPVAKIYINLINDTDPDYYSKFGRRTLATFTTFQAGLDLYQDERINEEGIMLVARDMIANYGFTPEELGKSFDDLSHRGFLKAKTRSQIMPYLKDSGLLPQAFSVVFESRQIIQRFGEFFGMEAKAPWIPDKIDYLNDIR